MAQASSGTYSFRPSFSDLLLFVFGRLQIRAPSITAEHMWNARMAAALMLSEWSQKQGPNLWKMQLLSIPLQQGVPTYGIPQNVVAILDYYVRQFDLTDTASLANCLTTASGSPTVTVTWADNELVAGNWVQFVSAVSIGGVLLYGFYQVQTVISPDQFTITASSNATSTVSASSGSLPVYDTTAASALVAVTLPNHGQIAGSTFTVGAATSVGGITLSGPYVVASITSSSIFVITAASAAVTTDTATENGGLVNIATQEPNNPPVDRVVTPISRTEYAGQPNKYQQSFPSTVWWDRSPAYGGSELTTWPVADQNGPYILFYWAMVQIEDIVLPGGVTTDVPFRFLEAFAAGLAAKLSWTYPPPPASGITIDMLDKNAERSWIWAAGQDTENVPLYIIPGLSSYWR